MLGANTRVGGWKRRLWPGRWGELALLLWGGAVALGYLALLWQRQPASPDQSDPLMVPIVALAALVLTSLVLWWRRPDADRILLPLTATLSGFGLLAVGRTATWAYQRQGVWIAAGAIVCLGMAIGPRNLALLRRYRYLWAFAGILLVAVTLIQGVILDFLGIGPQDMTSRLWLGWGPARFQTSEALKFLLVTFLAAYLAERRELLSESSIPLGPFRLPSFAYSAPLGVMVMLSMGLLVAERDLGATLLLFAIFLLMFYLATGRLRHLVVGTGGFLAAVAAAGSSFAHVRERFAIWLDPWSYPDPGYQVVQALFSFANGGIFGAGPGLGYPDYVPAAHTDFVLAAIAEQTGLAGTLGLLAAYVLLVGRALQIAARQRDDFRRLLCAGIAVVFGVQSFIILAGNLRLIPLTGITLPFVSYGGSSMLINFLMLGVLLRCSAGRYGG